MPLASLDFRLSLAVIILTALTVVAKGSRKWGKAGGILRNVLAVFYAVLVLAGVAGMCLSAWLIVATKGAALILLVVLVPLSMFLFLTGSSLFRFVLNPPTLTEAPKPLASSTGWGALDLATERKRNAGVAPHLRPEALAKFGDADGK